MHNNSRLAASLAIVAGLAFSVYASNGTVNYRFHDPASRHWPYFLTGVAVIIDNKDQIRYVPFRGLGIGAE